jgi:hypothetical protein
MKIFYFIFIIISMVFIFSGCASRSSLPFSTYSASECYQSNGYPEFLADGSIFCAKSPPQQLSGAQRQQMEQQQTQYQEQQRQRDAYDQQQISNALDKFQRDMSDLNQKQVQQNQQYQLNRQLKQINNNLNGIRYGY